jgi:5-methyltetrahydropteroyltriglutamate--homocysteine methyltransferase
VAGIIPARQGFVETRVVLANNLGYPRIGKHRELKRATEGYWAGKVSAEELARTSAMIRQQNWEVQRAAGISLIPSNDFSLYDQVLDTIALVGAIPERYRWDGDTVDLDTYFAMARGAQRTGLDVTPLEMTKWFDTNYHYLVPEFVPGQRFRLASTKPFDEFEQARDLGIITKPVLIGPVSFLLLGKSRVAGFDPLDLLAALLPIYRQVIAALAQRGAEWIQLDEPCFVQDRGDHERRALAEAYADLARYRGGARLLVQTYFDHVGDSYATLADLPVQGIGLDFVRGRQNLEFIRAQGFPADKVLAAGVVDGRNVWVTDLEAALGLLNNLSAWVSADRLLVNPSCSLMHVPLDVRLEQGSLDPRLVEWLAFAEQKLGEVVLLTRALAEGRSSVAEALRANAEVVQRRRTADWMRRPSVRERVAAIRPEDTRRGADYPQRREAQQRALNLPPFPTTTIGSFPQTPEVRRNRSRFQRGEISQEEYDRFIAEEIRRLIAFQEEIGLDVLVHGEFERSDMVEYFAERLDGFALTRHGWVQSYGSRYVRPPIIYGDVERPGPITVRWSRYAQSLTTRPVKGMLTGPVTILNWSFVRDDQPRSETCKQIALALRDEVRDLEEAGLRVIQVDEPAFREGLPLHRSAWPEYLDWAVTCYRLATAVAAPTTQIHSHMCYSEFGDIIEAIAALDADVISMSNSRSDLELLDTFRRFRYTNEIGPGVYDIHSPRVPSIDEIRRNLQATCEVLDPSQVWVNPDCGLKTRRWEEVIPSLRNMVQAAREMRGALVTSGS